MLSRKKKPGNPKPARAVCSTSSPREDWEVFDPLHPLRSPPLDLVGGMAAGERHRSHCRLVFVSPSSSGRGSIVSLQTASSSQYLVTPTVEVGITPLLLFLRNALFILPLLLTLTALWWAFTQYREYITLHPQDVNQSFLLLWETGFHTGNIVFAASTVAVMDILVFLLGSIIGIIAWFQQRQWKQRKQRLHMDLEKALAGLSDLSLRQMKQLRNPNVSQTQALRQVNQALEVSVKITQDVQIQIVQVAERMVDFQKSATSLTQSTGQLGQYLGNLGQNLLQLEQESSASARRLEATQERNLQTLADFVVQLDRIRINIDDLAQNVIAVLTKLDERFDRTIQIIDTTGDSFDKAVASLDSFGRSLSTGVVQLAQQTNQLTTITQRTLDSTQQLTTSTRMLSERQQTGNQIIETMLQQLSGVMKETNRSATSLTQLVDTGTDTMRTASSLVTKLEVIQQLLGRLAMLAGTQANRDPSLQGLLSFEQAQQSLGINPLTILSLLQTTGPQSMPALMREVQASMGQNHLDPAVFLDIITTFIDMNFVTLSGKSGSEQVKLTGLGKQVSGTLVSP